MKKSFILRDLFWLVLVVGIATCWWADHATLTSRVQALSEKVSRLEKSAAQQFWADV